MSTQLSLSLFGGLTIAVNDQPIAKPLSRKARALLCYLAVTGRQHSRSALAGLFWSDTSEEKARVSLRKELSRMRRHFDEYLIADRETIAFNTAALVAGENAANDSACAWLDVYVFETLLDTSANQAVANQAVAHGSIDELTEAVALYHGDFLEGFYVLNAPLFEEWILLQRGRLRESVLGALQTIVDTHLEQNNLAQAIESLRQLLDLEPWREEAHRQLMELLVKNGQRAAALAQYERCKEILDEELAVEPSEETWDLYVQICDDKIREEESRDDKAREHKTNDGPTEQSTNSPLAQPSFAAAYLARPKHNLPAQTTPFVGRKDEVADVQRLLTEVNARLVTIHGPGGMGKTRLAQEVASLLLDNYEHGVFFVPLAPLADPELIVSTIAENVGYRFDNDDGPLQKQLFEYLRPRNILLILDNAEHLLDGVELFSEILGAAPDVQLIVTSRERLCLMAETMFPLSGLATSGLATSGLALAESDDGDGDEEGAMDDDGSPVPLTDAMQLFMQTGRRVCPSFEPSATDWPLMHEVCRMVGGMPLGLILAGSWLEILTVTEIVDEIQTSLDFLATNFRDLPERQRSLQAIFDATWRQLSPDEQNVFKQLSVFHGDFTRHAAESVAGASMSNLTHLSYKSLLKRNGSGRYEIHELLRQFAFATLDEDLPEVNNRHSDYFCTRLQQHEVDLKGADQQVALNDILADSQNIRAAWQWAVRRQRIDNLRQSLESLSLFYLWQSRLEEGTAMWQHALLGFGMDPSEARKVNGTNPYHKSSLEPAQLCFVIQTSVWLCKFQRRLAKLDAAQQALRQAKALLTHPALGGTDTSAEQAALSLEEAELIAECDRQWQFALIEESVDLFGKIEDDWNRAQGVDMLGKGLRETGELTRSKEAIEEGLALRQTLGDSRGIAASLANLGNTVANMGQFDEAATLYRESIELFTQINDRGQQAYQIFRLAAALTHGGQFEEGFRVLNESIKIQSELELPNETGMNNILSGFALLHMGEYERAEECTLQAHLLTGRNTGYVKKDVGRAKQAMGDHAEAHELLTDAADLFRTRNDMNGLGQVLGCLGYLALRLGDVPTAREHIAENLKIAASSKVYLPSLTALAGAALLELEAGNVERAVELYALALDHKHVANSRWFGDVVGQHIDRAAQGLAAESVQAATQRGQAQKLDTTIEALWEEKEFAWPLV